MAYSEQDKLTAQKIYRNAELGLHSISVVIDDIKDDALFKAELKQEYGGYEKFLDEFSIFLRQNGIEIEDVNPLKKTGMTMGIKTNTAFDKSASHIATLMLKGTVNGISELIKIASDKDNLVDDEIMRFCKRLRELEEGYEERIKSFI